MFDPECTGGVPRVGEETMVHTDASSIGTSQEVVKGAIGPGQFASQGTNT